MVLDGCRASVGDAAKFHQCVQAQALLQTLPSIEKSER